MVCHPDSFITLSNFIINYKSFEDQVPVDIPVLIFKKIAVAWARYQGIGLFAPLTDVRLLSP